MNSVEARRRHLDISDESSWTWPEAEPSNEEVHELMSIML